MHWLGIAKKENNYLPQERFDQGKRIESMLSIIISLVTDMFLVQ